DRSSESRKRADVCAGHPRPRSGLARQAHRAHARRRDRRGHASLSMRSLFGVSQDALLAGIAVTVLVVAVVLGAAAWRNPLLPRLAWRNPPRRPVFAVPIPLRLTIGSVVFSIAVRPGDATSQSVGTVRAGAL